MINQFIEIGRQFTDHKSRLYTVVDFQQGYAMAVNNETFKGLSFPEQSFVGVYADCEPTETVLSLDEVAELRIKRDEAKEQQKRDRAAAKLILDQQVEEFKADPQYAHLTPVGEGYVLASKVAKNIRADLKKHFPGVKFQVRTDSDSVISVRRTAGTVDSKAVKDLLANYNKAEFCFYEDIVQRKVTPYQKTFGGVEYVIFY